MSRLSATGRVILGLLRLGPRTGYDVKRVTDYSTRYFWRASYGQIYPELRGLEAAGLVRAREEPHGRRKRRVYELTAAGEQAVSSWLDGTFERYDLRDEGLLKLFFGELLSEEALRELVRRRREWYELSRDEFRAIEQQLDGVEGPSGEVLRYGIDLMEWNAAWWAGLEQRLEAVTHPQPTSSL